MNQTTYFTFKFDLNLLNCIRKSGKDWYLGPRGGKQVFEEYLQQGYELKDNAGRSEDAITEILISIKCIRSE